MKNPFVSEEFLKTPVTTTPISNTGLDQATCFYIMSHFKELAEEYGVKI